jgi:hypothetical protein
MTERLQLDAQQRTTPPRETPERLAASQDAIRAAWENYRRGDVPTIKELQEARRWRVRLAWFLCLLAAATLAGVLAGWLK